MKQATKIPLSNRSLPHFSAMRHFITRIARENTCKTFRDIEFSGLNWDQE